VAGGTAAMSIGAVLVLLFPFEDRTAKEVVDPTKVGPDRFLMLKETRLEGRESAQSLRVEGSTNLVDDAVLSLAISSSPGHELQRYEAKVQGEGFVLEESVKGSFSPGSYVVTATFLLEEQPRLVQERLHFQPRRLSSSLPLLVESGFGQDALARSEFRALFDAVNRAPREPEALDRLDRRASELDGRIWLSKEKAALHKLRLAIEEARRPRFRREEFERLLLDSGLAIFEAAPPCQAAARPTEPLPLSTH
jgi:hypothetical protein